MDTKANMTIRVESVHIYPVKSLAGIQLSSANLRNTGFEFDRQWMLLGEDNRFLSQRNVPEMCLIQTALDERSLTLSKSGFSDLRVAFDAPKGNPFLSDVWGDAVAICEVELDRGDWFQEALGLSGTVRLVTMAHGYTRPQAHPERYGGQTTTLFADSAPYLIANQSSLDLLNNELTKKNQPNVPMDRFRANIVLSGMDAFSEHKVTSWHSSHYSLKGCYPRERCVITTIDQSHAVKDSTGEPFKTLQALNPMPDNPRGPAFAQLAVLGSGEGEKIRVGDILSISQ